MTENGYQKDEILKGERIILQTLDFRISSYCTPYSWVRKISKADDYDLQTRTLSKFLMEVTLLDHRFLRVKPSMVAAVGMYSARRMLGGDWVCMIHTCRRIWLISSRTRLSFTTPDSPRRNSSLDIIYLSRSLSSPILTSNTSTRSICTKSFLKSVSCI
jgi:Cyclin, C-terminal domain